MPAQVHEAITAVWRAESARIVASVARLVRDIGVAEDLAQDALVAALAHWPLQGLPDKPGAWLMTAARHRALDHLRHRQMAAARHDELARDLEARDALTAPDVADALDAARQDEIGDDMLRLMFTACHPVLPVEGRVALTLKLLGGLSTAEIARAHLVAEPTLAQRIVRAKRSLREAHVAFELPRGAALGERLDAVLEVVYLIFNEGYTATQGSDWMRPALCDEALRLGRMLAELAPDQAEVHGLLALMAIQASRTPARTNAQGEPILLADQDRTRWDPWLIRLGLSALAHAESLGQAADTYRLQAEIAACHARAAQARDTNWPRIAALYAQLMDVAPSPVVALNRAVAVGMAEGPAAGLALVETLLQDAALQRYPWLPAVQGDLLAKLGRRQESRQAFLRAADLAGNEREQALMIQRAQG